MTQLVMPAPLDSRLFHTVQKVDDYRQAVAEYLAQQESIEYANKRSSKRRKHASRREQFNEQY